MWFGIAKRATMLALLSAFLVVARDARTADAGLHTKTPPLLPISPAPDQFSQYPDRFSLQVAVFWTKPATSQDSPLPIIHCLKEMGIPFMITRELAQALKHRLVILYPEVDGRTFSIAEALQLETFVRQGGTVFAQDILWGGFKPLFGFKSCISSRKRYGLTFTGSDRVLKYLNRPEEREIRLGSEHYPEIFWTNGYVPEPGATVLSTFDDGSAALLMNTVGKGRTYLAGLSLLDVVLRSQSNRDFEAERHYVNSFEPGADVWLLILRAWYETYAADWVRLATMPDGLRSMVLLSHDVDWENSFAPGRDFARVERENRASSTFFIQTKYVDDANSKAFFFSPRIDILRQLRAGGSSLGSHSVIHSRGFNKFDLGSGQETYPAYQPRGLGFDTASGATVFGEVRVSKELLDGNIDGQDTIFFRAGHLRVPVSLPEALERSGYRYDSSFTADDVLSNFPYLLPRGLGFDEDSQIYEFPVTIEDEEAPGFARRVPQAVEVILANAENGAVNVLLIHSNESAQKAHAEDELLRALPPDIGKTDMLTFAEFWRARDQLQWTVKAGSTDAEVLLEVKAEETVKGITFEFKHTVSRVSDGAELLPDQHHVVLPELVAQQTQVFHLALEP
jgi:hypothetical protein